MQVMAFKDDKYGNHQQMVMFKHNSQNKDKNRKVCLGCF